MADESTEKFLEDLGRHLKADDEYVELLPDMDKSHNFEDWFDVGSYWNESVKELIKNWQEYVNSNQSDKHYNPSTIAEGILNGDAGYSFSSEPYVEPDKNIDTETYENVRGDDKIESVLKNKKQMQYTHTQNKTDGKGTNKYLRLLMPKYLRRVEVEDLNRNFWVISQVIGLISDYLLNPSSPLNTIISGILKEITQIWDNIYQIWKAIKRIDSIDERINQVAEVAQKTKVSIDLNRYPKYDKKGQEFRRMLGLDENSNDKITITYIGFPYVMSNKLLSWNFNVQSSEYYSAHEDQINTTIDKYNKDSNKFFRDNSSDFRLGCIIGYEKTDSTGGTSKGSVCYDIYNPYIFSDKDFYGAYYYGQTESSNIDDYRAYININKSIMVNLTIKNENEKIYTNSVLEQSIGTENQTIGLINIERDGYNKKPVNQILSDIMSYNFVLRDLDYNRPTDNKITSWDLIPEYYYSEKEIKQHFWSYLADFSTTANESYQALYGEQTNVIWTAPSVISKKQNIELLPSGEASAMVAKLYLEKLIATKPTLKLIKYNDGTQDTQSKSYENLITTFKNLILSKNKDDDIHNKTGDYYNFLWKFLYNCDLLPIEDLSAVAEQPRNQPKDEGKWLLSYEESIEQRLDDKNSISYNTLIKSLTNNSEKLVPITTIPWAYLEPFHYGNEMNIAFDKEGYTNIIQKKCGNCYDQKRYENSSDAGPIHWHLISSIIPEVGFLVYGGDRAIPIDYENKKAIKLESLTDDKNSVLHNAYIGKTPISDLIQDSTIQNYLNNTTETKSKIISKGLAAMSGLEAMALSNGSQTIRGQYIQPYHSKCLNNYWITIASNGTTGGRVQIRINTSNLRSFSCVNGLMGGINGVEGQSDCFPHNSSISLNYCCPMGTNKSDAVDDGNAYKKALLDQIIRFNSPENDMAPLTYLDTMSTFTELTSFYNLYGDKGDLSTTAILRKYSDQKEGYIIDGFLGSENISYLTNQFETIKYTQNTDTPQDVYSSITWRGLPMARYGSTNTGAYGRIRPIKLFTNYNMLSTTGEYMEFSNLRLKNILNEKFFEQSVQKEIFTIQMDFSSYGTGGTINNLCTLSIAKDENESSWQKELNNFEEPNKTMG